MLVQSRSQSMWHPRNRPASPRISRCCEGRGAPEKENPSRKAGLHGWASWASPGSFRLRSPAPCDRNDGGRCLTPASKGRGPQSWGPQREVLTRRAGLSSSVLGPPPHPARVLAPTDRTRRGGRRATSGTGNTRRLHEGNKAKKTQECIFAFGGPATVGTLPLGP